MHILVFRGSYPCIALPRVVHLKRRGLISSTLMLVSTHLGLGIPRFRKTLGVRGRPPNPNYKDFGPEGVKPPQGNPDKQQEGISTGL